MLALDGPEVARFAELTRGVRPVALAGFIERNRAGKPFITQVVARDGEVVAHYRKRTIVDEEVEWFAPGRDVAVFRQGGVGCGIAVCADIEDPAVFREAFEQGADLVLHAAAPGLHGEQATRDWQGGYDWWEGLCNYRLGDYARELGCWIAVATQAGRTADEDFPGGGFLFDPSGRRVYSTRDWNPCAVYLDVDLERQSVAVLLEQCDGS